MAHTRREFLLSTALAVSASGAEPRLRFPAAPRDRIAVASYSFRSVIDTPRNRAANPGAPLIALKDFPAAMAKRYGIRNVELLGSHFPSTDAAYLSELREALKAAGSRVVNIPTGVGASMYDPDPAKRRVAVDNAKAWIDRAAALDCPGVRVHIQQAKGSMPDVDLVAPRMAEIAAYGESKNVVVNVENDDPVSEDAFFVAKVLDRVNSPWVRALPDFCNSMLKGDEKFNYAAVEAMFARASLICHVKDSEVDHGKVFRVDLTRTFGIAKKSGFRGYFSVEWEGEGDVWVENGRLIEETARQLSL